MPRIAVFDSGLGSVSIIEPLRQRMNLDIVYYADTASFPYGAKTPRELKRIIIETISGLRRTFEPDIVLVGSNTPSLLFPEIMDDCTFGVYPPLKRAAHITKTKNIAILGTSAAVSGPAIFRYIRRCRLPADILAHAVDASMLVRLVEDGRFDDDAYCQDVIRELLGYHFTHHAVDVATLSSTHLPFLRRSLESAFPNVTFLDPADEIAKTVCDRLEYRDGPASLRIFTSGSVAALSAKLAKLGIREDVVHILL